MGFRSSPKRRHVPSLDGYLAPLPLFWDGIHVPGVWARVRENYMLFPWHRMDNTVRPDIDLPPPAMLHDVAADILRLGDGWRVGYASAFRYRVTAEGLSGVDHPVTIMARRDDLLYPHLERLPTLPDVFQVEPHTFDVGRWAARIHDLLGNWVGSLPVAPPPPKATGGARMVGGQAKQVCLRECGEGRPLVVLHDVPGWSNDVVARTEALVGKRRVLAPDLPGCGLSDAFPEPTVDSLASALEQALVGADVDDLDIYAEGLSAVVALSLAKRMSQAVGRVVLNGPPIVPSGIPADDYCG